jgi:hypothetical protein
MQKFTRPHILGNETWGGSIRHLEIPDVQPHVLPNLKFNMHSCFIGMLFIPLLSLLKKLISLGVFFFTPLDHLHNFLKVIFMSQWNG